MNENNLMEDNNLFKVSMKMSMPIVISMISLALYSLVDSIFISNIDSDALTAISLSYPIQAIVTAIGLGTGIGVNSLIARKFGEKKNEEVNNIIFNGMYLILFSFVVIAILGFAFSKNMIGFFTNNSNVISYGVTYLTVCLVFSFGLLYQILFEKIAESHGKTYISMLIQFGGALINLILDPLFIYGYFNFPKLGILGAAIATVIGQILGALFGLVMLRKNKIKITLLHGKLENKIIKEIYQVGLPTIITESLAAFVTLILNGIFEIYSEFAVPLWGIYLKVQSFIFMIVYGFNYGMIPIVGYKFGAKKYLSMKKVIRLYLLYAFIVMGVGVCIFKFAANYIFKVYDAEQGIVDIGVNAFSIISIGFLFAAVSLVMSSVFQAIGKGMYSLIIYLLRQLVVSIPIVYCMRGILDVTNVWYAFVISEIVAMIASLILYFIEVRKLKVDVNEQA